MTICISGPPHKFTILLAVLLLTFNVSNIYAQDKWDDGGCSAPVTTNKISPNSNVAGNITPSDTDSFFIDMREGDFINARISVKAPENKKVRIYVHHGTITDMNGTSIRYDDPPFDKFEAGKDFTVGNETISTLSLSYNIRIYAERNNPCVEFTTGGIYIGRWKMSSQMGQWRPFQVTVRSAIQELRYLEESSVEEKRMSRVKKAIKVLEEVLNETSN